MYVIVEYMCGYYDFGQFVHPVRGIGNWLNGIERGIVILASCKVKT